MAGAHPFLTTLRGIVKTLDDDTLAALANKGLLRRAQKDLETSKPEILSIEPGKLSLKWSDATIEIPELVAKSSCSCPATGICRHILGALVYLRDDPDVAALAQPIQKSLDLGAEEAPAELPSPEVVLANLSDDDLQKWVGKALFRKAVKALAGDPLVEIEIAGNLVIRFPTRNITCRWIPGGDFTSLVCSCQAETVCEHVVTAILAYQASLGTREIVTEAAPLDESAGAPRTRAEVLESTGVVLRNIVSLGLARISEATRQRLITLAVSAHGVDLPRLERMLKSLADELDRMLRRDARASSANALQLATRIEALRTALAKSFTPALVGQHRSQYYNVGQLTLVGVGAKQWRSGGGYHGVTVYFWDESRKGWSTWSESRPVDQPGFDPASRFFSDGPWTGCSSPEEAARSAIKVTGAWRNAQGRISGRASTRAIITAASRITDIPDPLADWTQLADRAKTLFAGRLGDRTENQELVLLVPKAWGPPAFDSLKQELIRPVVDDNGRVLDLWLPFHAQNETAVDRLEHHDPKQTTGVFGAIRLVAGRLCVQPISLFDGDEIVSLNLIKPAANAAKGKLAKPTAAKIVDEEETLSGESDDEFRSTGSGTPLGRFLITAQAEIEALAESGIAVRHNNELLQLAAVRFESLGLLTCSRTVRRLAESVAIPARLSEPAARDAAAGALLQAGYVLQLAADHEIVAGACAGLA